MDSCVFWRGRNVLFKVIAWNLCNAFMCRRLCLSPRPAEKNKEGTFGARRLLVAHHRAPWVTVSLWGHRTVYHKRKRHAGWLPCQRIVERTDCASGILPENRHLYSWGCVYNRLSYTDPPKVIIYQNVESSRAIQPRMLSLLSIRIVFSAIGMVHIRKYPGWSWYWTRHVKLNSDWFRFRLRCLHLCLAPCYAASNW